MTTPALRPDHPAWVNEAVVAQIGMKVRELQVLRGIARGLTNVQIAAELWLTPDTIRSHAIKLYRRIGATDRPNAVAIAYHIGLLRTAAGCDEEMDRRRAAAGPEPLPGQTVIPIHVAREGASA